MNKQVTKSADEMINLGKEIAKSLMGGECVELIGDVGAGKTTLVKGVVQGLGSQEEVQSPSFTINRVYQAKNNLEIYHYDFYRLKDAGIMQHEIQESINDKDKIALIEWGESVRDIFPRRRLIITISVISENERCIEIGGLS